MTNATIASAFSPERQEQIKKVITDITKDEAVTFEFVGTNTYVYTSELGALRLMWKYRHAPNVNGGYSENLKTWYFLLSVSN